MRGALVLHGEPPSPAELALLRGCAAVVCADGGALALLAAGMKPDLIVGDMDGLGAEGLRQAAALGVPLERHPARKDLTDGELALDALLARQPHEVLILGAHGGRSAMALASLQLLRRCHALGLDARMVGRGEVLRFLGAGQSLGLRGHRGAGLDLLAWERPARVRLAGTAWAGATTLSPHAARGVSNRVVADEAAVEVLDGLALVVLTAGPQ